MIKGAAVELFLPPVNKPCLAPSFFRVKQLRSDSMIPRQPSNSLTGGFVAQDLPARFACINPGLTLDSSLVHAFNIQQAELMNQ